MFNIVLCDDDTLVMNHEEKIIRKVLETIGGQECLIQKYEDATELLRHVPLDEVDIFFLDYEMPSMTGIELAAQIRKQRPDAFIAMTTGYTSCVNDSFRVGANRFLLKPFQQEEFEEAIRSAIGKKQQYYLTVMNDRRDYHINQKLIYEITASYSMTEVYTEKEQFHISDSLCNVEPLLMKDYFCRINRNQIVNMLYVEKEGSDYYLRGKKLKVSRRREKEVLEKYVVVDVARRD